MRKIIMALLVLTVGLTSCSDDDEPQHEYTPAAHATRTVLVYMSGENNLTVTSGTRFLNSDLTELIEGSKHLDDNQRLLVFVDSLNSNSQQASNPYIIEVHGGKTYELYRFDKDFYASDPAYFKQILQWTVENASADSYGLILWGHAKGWLVESDTIASQSRQRRAYGVDTGEDQPASSGSRWLNIKQMANLLQGLPKLEFLFTDCCNMMSAEVGYELRNAANYLIGSPAEIPGNGAPYDRIVPQLFKQGSELYRGIIDTYFNYYTEAYKNRYDLKGNSVPLAVIETKYMEELAQATHDVMEHFSEPYPAYPMYPNLTNDSITFYFYEDAPVMFDMRAFVKTYAPADEFERWDQTYRRAVPYFRQSLKWMTAYNYLELSFKTFKRDCTQNGCVSMFIPRYTEAYFTSPYRYNYTFRTYGWNRVMDWSRFGWDEDITYPYPSGSREQ